jgi:LmbE family N-acetylglucosaminyl deacetylase
MKRYVCGLLLLLGLGALWAGNHNAYLLPEDRGAAGALAALEKLPVYVRVLQTTAHPDDESSGTLTWLSRNAHAQTALFCLTRGEGGQNILGNEKYDALGLVRTGELLEACRYYGTELYFGANLDFGFSKTAEETLSKWGHDTALEEMVRFIRWWRPTIILSRFQGDSGDGHGHHQAAGILTKEAFRAAGDPRQFPEQFKRGLQPWQAKQLYVSSRPWGETASGEEKIQTISVPVGRYDPVLGRTYREIAAEGYSKHRTQGNGNTFVLPFADFESHKLIDLTAGNQRVANSFFTSFDTSLMAILDLAGDENQIIPFLKTDLGEIQKTAAEAVGAFQITSPEKSAIPAAKGVKLLGDAIKKIEASSLSGPAKNIVLQALNEKLRDFQNAVNAVLGIRLVARTATETAVPGEEEGLQLYFFNSGPEKLDISRVSISSDTAGTDLAGSKTPLELKQVTGGSSEAAKLTFTVRPDAGLTEPFWYLNKSTDARYTILPTQNEFAPFGPAETKVEVRYLYQGIDIPVYATGMAQAGDPMRGVDFVDFQVVPALSVSLDPGIEIAPMASGPSTHEFQASILNNTQSSVQGTLKLVGPAGWQTKPEAQPFSLSRKGEAFTAKFTLLEPPGAKPGSYSVEAAATLGNQEFRRGYKVISYPENWTRNVFSRAASRIEKFDVQVAPDLTIGYIPGAGDEIPIALERLGLKPRILSAEDLAFGDLSRYSTIITGIRAYNVNGDLKTHNQRLLDYVANGGTLIVQYARPPAPRAAQFVYGPYPMSGGDSDRITVEDSPIRMLDPSHPIFNRPNKITEDDFRGWVQERGLYFMKDWDKRYTALLSGNDPGDAPQNGGMLYARYGKGHYIYTGYAWFRQLPAGNHGAYRIFANMISLGKY